MHAELWLKPTPYLMLNDKSQHLISLSQCAVSRRPISRERKKLEFINAALYSHASSCQHTA